MAGNEIGGASDVWTVRVGKTNIGGVPGGIAFLLKRPIMELGREARALG